MQRIIEHSVKRAILNSSEPCPRLGCAARLVGTALLAQALLACFDLGAAAAQEVPPADPLIAAPLELYEEDGSLSLFPGQGEYYFPKGSAVFVPGHGWQRQDTVIPGADGGPGLDLHFVPFDQIPTSSLEDWLFGGGGDALYGGAGDDALGLSSSDDLFGLAEADPSSPVDADWLDDFANGGGSFDQEFFDAIEGLAGDIDFTGGSLDGVSGGWPSWPGEDPSMGNEPATPPGGDPSGLPSLSPSWLDW